MKRLRPVVPALARLALVAAAGMLCGWGGARADAPPAVSAAPASGLFVDCRGQPSSSPTVILQSGAFGTSADWDLVLDDLAKAGRVCAYDRAGVGASPPREGTQDVTAIANELAALLDGMGETAPVILVGHSNGALYTEAFAALWPKPVAGLVYINGVNSDDLDHPALLDDLAQERFLADMAVTGAHLGLAPMVAQILVDSSGLKGDAAERKSKALDDTERLKVARDEDRAIIPGLSTVRQLGGSPPNIPTAVIVGATDPDDHLSKAWRAAETAPAMRAKVSWVLDAVGATHTSPLGRDRAYVAAAVGWLRSGFAQRPAS